MTVELWVTQQEVAKHLQVAEDAMHRWISRKDMPATKVGRMWRFKLTEVDWQARYYSTPNRFTASS